MPDNLPARSEMMTSDAFLSGGRWVADCPVPACRDAVALYPEDRQGKPSPEPVYVQRCYRGHEFRLIAPPDDVRAEIERILSDRPEPERNWLPAGHPWGESNGMKTGQTPADMIAERAGADAPAAEGTGPTLAETLAAHGITVNSDGSFTGALPGAGDQP